MTNSQKKRTSISPKEVMERADVGFLEMARTAGVAAHTIQSGTARGLSTIGGLFKRKKKAKKKSKVERTQQQVVEAPVVDSNIGLTEKQPTVQDMVPPVEFKPEPIPIVVPPLESKREFPPVQPIVSTPKPASEPRKEVPPGEPPKQTNPPPKAAFWPKLGRKPKADPPQQVAVVRQEPIIVSEPVVKQKKAAVPNRASVPRARVVPPKPTKTKDPSFRPVLDIETLLKMYPIRDRVQQVNLRMVMDELARGEEVSREALDKFFDLGKAAEPFLIAICLQTTSPTAVETCLEGLEKYQSDNFESTIAVVMASPDTRLRLSALRVAQQLPADKVRTLLLSTVNDPAPEVRRRSLTYLSWVSASWAVAAIRERCGDSDPTVQWAAIKALSALRPEELEETLELIEDDLLPVYKQRAKKLVQESGTKAKKGSKSAIFVEPETEPESGPEPIYEPELPILVESVEKSDEPQKKATKKKAAVKKKPASKKAAAKKKPASKKATGKNNGEKKTSPKEDTDEIK